MATAADAVLAAQETPDALVLLFAHNRHHTKQMLLDLRDEPGVTLVYHPDSQASVRGGGRVLVVTEELARSDRLRGLRVTKVLAADDVVLSADLGNYLSSSGRRALA